MINRRSFLLGAGGAALAVPALSGFATARASSIRWDVLSKHLDGRVVLPSDADYQTAKQLYQVQFDATSPKAVAYAASPADVAVCLRFAQDNAIPVAARSGGHSLGGYSTTPGLVIDVSKLNGIAVGSETTRLGAGAQLVDITNTLAPNGLTISGGYCPTVAVGGFLQGGGFGLFTRSIGMASDKVKSARVVLADGSYVTASAEEHSDLYWALRGGGGGNFGIVTSFEITPSPLTKLAACTLTFSYDQSLDLLDAWPRWLADAPWTMGSGLNISLDDAAPGKVPVATVFLGSMEPGPGFTAEVDRLISMIGQTPVSRQEYTAPYQSVMMYLYSCADLTVPECHRSDTDGGKIARPGFGTWRSRLFSEAMPREGWEKALAVMDTDRIAGQARRIQVSALGGQVNTMSRTATAYVHRDTLYSASFLTATAAWPVSDEARAAAQRFSDNGFAVLDPYSNGETYQNFIDPNLSDWQQSAYAENSQRLAQIKGKYDPYNVFSFAQSIR
ncbi:FAD-binding oxidoreductase [Streptomyces sp. NK08204]|uniref:FAD-binding oxidoreductase n=1 Tax=Streptomyces sp. NK08204 TaxID=2873260 RepID=UPI001CEC5C76|nr:FAD-binding oxidoreductase [Streptomyces sp. NK08204]